MLRVAELWINKPRLLCFLVTFTEILKFSKLETDVHNTEANYVLLSPGSRLFPGDLLLQTPSTKSHSLRDEKAKRCVSRSCIFHLKFMWHLGGNMHKNTGFVAVLERPVHTSWRSKHSKDCADSGYIFRSPLCLLLHQYSCWLPWTPWQLICSVYYGAVHAVHKMILQDNLGRKDGRKCSSLHCFGMWRPLLKFYVTMRGIHESLCDENE